MASWGMRNAALREKKVTEEVHLLLFKVGGRSHAGGCHLQGTAQ
jgi:hypothetical protein